MKNWNIDFNLPSFIKMMANIFYKTCVEFMVLLFKVWKVMRFVVYAKLCVILTLVFRLKTHCTKCMPYLIILKF